MSTPRRLVIVESPAKARIIQGYLGAGYDVKSSVGHIRDLPTSAGDVPEQYRGTEWAKTGVDIEHDFKPMYVVSAPRKPLVRELKQALSGADELLLATDEDREGEAIAWHLVQVLQPKVPYRRMVFHEITKDAIQQAAQTTRPLNTDLVDAQETRRIVDRLYGYEVSPVLWRRVATGLSAGRVQSVALRLVVDRERERIAFTAAGYCDIRGTFLPGSFTARLLKVDGKRIASGRDFDDDGQLTSDVLLLDEPTAQALTEALRERPFTVSCVEQKPGTRRPTAPFMTSTLQQEGGRRLRWTAKRVMDVAQRLYEGGYITYMRTDSTTLSEQAISAARDQARALYGAEYVPDAPRRYDRKVKNAQEAHEAIRPSGDQFRTPGQVSGSLSRDEFLLYELIWKRTLASQMVDAKVATTTLRLAADSADGRAVEFSASGTVVVFPGFLAAYSDVAEGDSTEQKKDAQLPPLREGDSVSAVELVADPHRTTPPARYTEATLIRALEEKGIGRPSTFASIINTIQERDYVWKRGSALVPSFLGMTVIRLLENHFAPLVDYSFTARMEENLDAIAAGDDSRLKALERFYRGDDGLGFEGLRPLIDKGGDAIDARELSTFPIRGSDAVVRVGRYGPYLERGEADRVNVPTDLAPDELTVDKVEELYAAPRGDRELGSDPATGHTIVAKNGRYGPYVTEVLPDDAPPKTKPRTASLFKDMSPDTVTLDEALRLLTLPREVGVDPVDGEPVLALNGRYGPYVKKGSESRSLADESQLFTVTLDQALALLAEPPRRRGQRATTPAKELGTDPVSGKPILVRDGRFGPYVTDGEYNATIPKSENAEELTLERASDLLVERRAKGPAKKSTRKAAKGSSARKTTKATRPAAKKAAAKKATAKKAAKAAAESGVS